MDENIAWLIKRLRMMAETGWHPIGNEAADTIELLLKREAAVYDDCIDAVNKIKNDPITDMGSHHRLEGSFQTAKTWMVAIAEDIEREIVARKEALQK